MCTECGCASLVHDDAGRRTLTLAADVLAANDRIARHNRAHFAAHGVTAVNLLSSPGSGKTTLLCATIDALRRDDPARAIAVIEGDQHTQLDAERVRATGVPVVQVNTGKGCHLDAQMVARAFTALHDHDHTHHDDLEDGHEPHDAPARASTAAPHARAPHLLFIENVGNLVCPALWDLGEAAKAVVLSVTEGEDKPLKYPDMFAAAQVVLLNKTDLLPYVEFDVARCVEAVRRVNPHAPVLPLSARTGDGMSAWLAWLSRLAAVPSSPAGALP